MDSCNSSIEIYTRKQIKKQIKKLNKKLNICKYWEQNNNKRQSIIKKTLKRKHKNKK